MLPDNAFALVNADDKNSKMMLQNTLALKKTYGLEVGMRFQGQGD